MYLLQLVWNGLSTISSRMTEPRALIVSFLGLVGAYVFHCLVDGLFFCPTRHIPGPFLTRFGKIYFIRLLFKGALSPDIHKLHQKYGPVLRMGPNLIDVQLQEAIYKAWGGQNERKIPWDKDPDFCRMSRIGMNVDNLVSIASPIESKRVRRLMGPPFAKKFLSDQVQIFKDCTKTLLAKLDDLRMKNDNKVDVLHEYKTYALDILTEFAFGGYFKGGSIRPGLTEIKLMDQSVFENVFSNVFPTVSAIIKRIHWSKLDWTRSTNQFIQLCEQAIREYKKKVKPGSRRDSLGQLIISKGEDGLTLSHEDLVAESLILLFAGVETSTTALTYVTYALGKYPELQAELAEELSGYSDVDSLDPAGLEKLPLLNSVIRESMRFWPPAPAPFARLSPPEGATLGGYYIPGGVCVSRAAYGACRDPEVFDEPEVFNPKRWIGLSREQETKMWDQSMIFSYGPRICLGRDLAMMEIRILTASMILNYTWSGVPDVPGKWDEEMKPYESMVIRPWNMKCVLELKRK